jgi:glycosyltransferase involved in cell wall biosynthesis
MRLSAIVPTHERPEALRTCLESLQAQRIDGARLEVIVVDDGSRSDIAAVVADVAANGVVAMRCERQALGGLNSARNRGADVAQGDVLAFLDDDTIVSAGWADAVCEAFETTPCAGLGGRIELGLAAAAPDWLGTRRYYLAEYDLGQAARWIEREDPVPVGANCAVRRNSFEQLGGFRRGLDRIAGSLVSNGDTEFFQRLRDTGARLRYEPGASVVHCVPADRLTVPFFIRRHYAQGLSDELLLKMREGGSALRRRAILIRWLTSQLVHAARAFARDLVSGRGTVVARFEASYWAGRLKGAGMQVPPPEQPAIPRAPTESTHP